MIELKILSKVLKREYPFISSIKRGSDWGRQEYIDITIPLSKLMEYYNVGEDKITPRTRMNAQFDYDVMNLAHITDDWEFKQELRSVQSHIIHIMNRVRNSMPRNPSMSSRELTTGFFYITENNED